jgi:amino acid adenylation domain-containing protein
VIVEQRTSPACAIAIIGCAGRFPGAADVAGFWRNLCAGIESVRTFADGELEDAFPAEVRRRPEFVRARSILDGVESFDAPFFGMHLREAEMTDPQHRVFLECCWHALEDAGYDPAVYRGLIGVFAGCSFSSYLLRNVLASRADVERFTSDYQVGSYPELLGAGFDFLATRVAYKLDLRGPAMTLQSACSTSLLAVAQACQTLMLRQADMMLAGAVSISFPQKRGYLYAEGGMVSPDGHCRTFDERAGGTVFGDGAGVVVLKRLEDALAEGDSIYAVIRGFGVNNDGSGKVGYTAPSVEGQATAVRAAYAMAGVAPETIGFIECHGTATPLGDPIELAALNKAFGRPIGTRKSCALGSAKTNVGHLDVASGVTGLIKTALAVYHGKIPPTLHFSAPNPRTDFSAGPFFVNTQLAQWPNEHPTRRAAVSSFGVGGTNVHLILESAPQAQTVNKPDGAQLIVLSARSARALSDARARLAVHLREADGAALGDIAYTLQVGRRPFPFRCAIVASSTTEASDALEKSERIESRRTNERAPVVAFMFPGQGAQYVGMGRDLYDRVVVFRENIDRCADILRSLIDADLRAVLYEDGDARKLMSTDVAQPALFAVEYALAEVLRSCGIVPAATIGHSVGEFVAACLAGVFSLEDALALVAERGRLMRQLPTGAMLAVRAGEAELVPMLDGELGIAALNAPGHSVVAGPIIAIERFERRLNEAGAISRRLHTSHAFHSAMMDPVIAPLRRKVAAVQLHPPSSPYVSGVTGTWIDAEDAVSADYWARHCREPVRFALALHTLVDADVDTLIEVGPGASLASFALQGVAKGGRATVLRTLPGSDRERPDLEFVLETLGRLWIAGAQPDWSGVHRGSIRSRVSLPAYPFERTRCWIEPLRAAIPEPSQPLATPAPLPDSYPKIDPMEGLMALQTDGGPSAACRADRVQRELVTLLEDLSGESLADADSGATFLELGFDSLSLGRFVQQLQSRYGVSVTFRQLLGEIPSIAGLADYIGLRLPPESPAGANGRVPEPPETLSTLSSTNAGAAIEAVVREQLHTMQELMRNQLQALQSLGREVPAAGNGSRASAAQPSGASAERPESNEPQAPSRLNTVRIAGLPKTEITPAQRAHIDDLIARTVVRTAESKRLTQRYRGVLADPRVAAGFRSEWKEMVYPITCVRAKGSRIWDVDGNEYIDLLNGFGQTAFGHAPDFVVDAVAEQLQRNFAIGPQTPLAGEVAELFCELTGNERVTFCNTGSEAVMASLRVARTVTGRTRVVMFEGSYHGQFDEVLVQSARSSHRSLPVALGIPDEAVANIVVLPYGAPESLTWVREHQHELAAVVVESVQSRHPALRPQQFLLELRRITEASGTAFVFDEVVTGFRMHPGGMQAIFGIRADLATYGKVVGGGLPIGILAGKARFMDALDGGAWQYGDDSFPQVAPTFLAGTFVRHPLAMAAVLAVLRYLKAEGPELQERIGSRTAALVDRLNGELEQRGILTRIESYGSLCFLNFSGEDRLASLLFYHLRLRGVYVQEGFPSFLTTEHTDGDVNAIVAAFAESLDELQSVAILAPRAPAKRQLNTQQTESVPTEVPLTEEQIEIWLAAQLGDDASCSFNESVALHLRGALNEAAFQSAWDGIMLRHDALRGSFGATGEQMCFARPERFAFSRSDVSGRSADEREAVLRELIDEEARKPFNLAHGPLSRGHLVCLSPTEYAFVFTAHHIVCDGWSMNVLLDELGRSYTALSAGTEPQLADPLGFASYACRQAQRDAVQHDRVEAYWLAQFRDAPPLLELPTDRPRAAQKTFNGSTRTSFVDRDTYRTIKKGGAAHGCTLFVTLLAAFDVLVGRLADQNDVVIGVPTAGQAMLDGALLVGHCVNFLPIRARFARETSLAEFLVEVKHRVLDAYEHQQYTLGTLVRKLGLPRESNRVPLAEIQFNLERLADDLDFGSLDVKVEPNPKAFVNFDLFLNVVESDDGLRIDCDYNTDLFDAATIDRWLGYYRTILDEIGRDATQRIVSVDFLAATERRLLAGLNQTAAEYPGYRTVHEAIGATATLRAEATAVRCGDDALTYAVLQHRVNQIANYLLARIGEGPRRVAVCVERSSDLVVALLATLSAGCAYVPLDPTHPPKRLRAIIEDAQVAAVVCDGFANSAVVPSGVEMIDLRAAADAIASTSDAPPAVHVCAEDTAYVIYTSGSTGTPKGVEVTHGSVVNLLMSMSRRPGLRAGDMFFAVTTVSFDIAALELFLPLAVGATVVIASRDDIADARTLVATLRRVGPTAMQATPALWAMLLAAGFRPPAGLKMLCGGEALPRELANDLLVNGAELWNVYGPTETTIWSTCAKIEPGDEPISVGTPIANSQVYVLDSNDEVVPVGIVGQLHIAGDGVARGYVDRLELTQEKFVANPFGAGRMYRTGDAARLTPEGRIQILGRLDDQVKLRGFRIELGEIEAVVRKKAGFASVAVLLREDFPGDRRLACYYVDLAESGRDAASLRALVAEDLPDYMIPAAWIKLEQMPLSAAGKVDRSALPAPQAALPEAGFRAPETPTEIILARIWAEVLHVARVGLEDDFFALGGDSIQLFQITARANQSGLRLAAKELFRHPTIAQLARRLDEGPREGQRHPPTPAPKAVIRLRNSETSWQREPTPQASEYRERTSN